MTYVIFTTAVDHSFKYLFNFSTRKRRQQPPLPSLYPKIYIFTSSPPPLPPPPTPPPSNNQRAIVNDLFFYFYLYIFTHIRRVRTHTRAPAIRSVRPKVSRFGSQISSRGIHIHILAVHAREIIILCFTSVRKSVRSFRHQLSERRYDA